MPSSRRSSRRSLPRLPLVVAAAAMAAPALAADAVTLGKQTFKFSLSDVAQCGQMTVTWQGGKGPYHLLTVPWNVKDSAEVFNVSLPQKDGSGPWTHTFDFKQAVGQQFVATMYDSSGWGSGGVSDVRTVQSSEDSSCLTPENKDKPIDGQGFWMEPTKVEEVTPCTTAKFGWNENFVLPASLAGIIPNGDTFEIPITNDKKSIDWLVNAEGGTPIVFAVFTNGKYGTAGSLTPFQIGLSTQNGCLDSSSPGTTTAPQPTGNPTPSGSESDSGSQSNTGTAATPTASGDNSQSGSGSKSSGTSAGTIAGAAVGSALGALLIAGLVLWCFLKRRKRPQDTHAVSIDLQETDESSPMRRNAANAAGYDGDRDPYLNPYPMSVPEPSFHRGSIATSSGLSGVSGSGITGLGSGSGSSSNLTEKQRLQQLEAMASSSRYQNSHYAMSEEVDSEAVGPIAMPPPSYDHVLRVTNPSPQPPPSPEPRSP